ncbi:THAP domain-containing protein 8, partial [Alligator sinensis]|uniref:THAP domain-containing protein 8 n=1 Tax=Alligator sinensis TaxID=38654 RepID=A0A3Q0HHW9_ALLSI
PGASETNAVLSCTCGLQKRENPSKPPCEVPTKKLILEGSADKAARGSVPLPQKPDTLEALAIAIDPGLTTAPIYVEAQPSVSELDFQAISSPLVGTVNLMPLVQIMEPLNAVALTVTSPTQGLDPISLHLPSQPTVALSPEAAAAPDAPLQPFTAEIAVPGEDLVPEQTPHALVAAVEPRDLADHGALIIENVAIEPFLETDTSAAAAVLSSLQAAPTQMVAYFETIPTAPAAAAPSAMGPLMASVTPPETVLSSALTVPVVSTVPIVSNYAAGGATDFPSPAADVDLETVPEEQLEEHRYHKHQLSTEELVGVVMVLQKKVKVLQQRHRRHCAKLEAMEGVVEQLRKESLVSEEKLKLLEMACFQSSAVIPESGGTVAIICQEDDQALVYAVPQLPDEGNETIIHVEEQ